MAKRVTKMEADAFVSRGRLRVSDGLYVQVSKWGTKSWEFRFTIHGRIRTMGLGAYSKLTLADARARVTLLAADVERGIDPIEVKRAKRPEAVKEVKVVTFEEAALAYIDAKVDVAEGGFKNPKHRQQWRNTLGTYANPIIGNVPVADVNADLVLKVLQQETTAKGKSGHLWNLKTETASRLRGRIEKILSWAAFRGLRPKGDNPARWKGHLETELISSKSMRKIQHHSALPYPEIASFMAELRLRKGNAARALEFSILTAARSGEVRGATWEEFDLNAGEWTIAEERMKAGKEHCVALCDEAIALIRNLPKEARNPLVFVGTAKTGGLSENAMKYILDNMGRKDLTQHGFRSTFRDWAGETTAHPREVIEHALAHSLKDKAEAAYARGTLMEKRRLLMADWGRYCGLIIPSGNVVKMRG